MAEQVFVSHQGESSPDSYRDDSSSKIKSECDDAGESKRSVTPLPSGSISSNLITHTNGESPAGHGCCLENRLGIKASRVRISFSPHFFGELTER